MGSLPLWYKAGETVTKQISKYELLPLGEEMISQEVAGTRLVDHRGLSWTIPRADLSWKPGVSRSHTGRQPVWSFLGRGNCFTRALNLERWAGWKTPKEGRNALSEISR